MVREAPYQTFHRQRELFCKLQVEAVQKDPSGLSYPSAVRASDFAEALILCPSIEAATNRIALDLEGARSFLVVADKVRAVASKPNDPVLSERMSNGAPFYFLACVVLEQLKRPGGGSYNIEV